MKYRFNSTPLKILRAFDPEPRKQSYNSYTIRTETIAKANPSNGSKGRGITIPRFQLYLKTTAKSAARNWGKNTHAKEGSTAEDADAALGTPGVCFVIKGPEASAGAVLQSTNGSGEPGGTHADRATSLTSY